MPDVTVKEHHFFCGKQDHDVVWGNWAPRPSPRRLPRKDVMYFYEKSKTPWARIMLSITGTGLLGAMVIAKENFACEATGLWLLLMAFTWGDY